LWKKFLLLILKCDLASLVKLWEITNKFSSSVYETFFRPLICFLFFVTFFSCWNFCIFIWFKRSISSNHFMLEYSLSVWWFCWPLLESTSTAHGCHQYTRSNLWSLIRFQFFVGDWTYPLWVFFSLSTSCIMLSFQHWNVN
jgi:hypothetical protein